MLIRCYLRFELIVADILFDCPFPCSQLPVQYTVLTVTCIGRAITAYG